MRHALEWVDDHLEVIDQTRLPASLEVRALRTSAEVVDAIRRLVVRGAPALGACGAFGVALGLAEGRDLDEVAAEVAAARPTAVNLERGVRRAAAAARRGGSALDEALRIVSEDREACRRIGEWGRRELRGVRRILTHCNTGRLATCGIGTALGIVYAKAEASEPVEVVATESRPLLQGGRLTAWELREAGIPVTLVVDAAAGAVLRGGRVDAVVVGADRIAANGDVANKIGTYTLAVLARASGVPFYVAAPRSTIDLETPDGASIVIEERDPLEVTGISGAGIPAWNPAFDMTPAYLVTALVTDAGVLRPPYRLTIPAAMG